MKTFTFLTHIQTARDLTEAQVHSALAHLLDAGMTACEYDSSDKDLPTTTRDAADEALSLNITFEPT